MLDERFTSHLHSVLNTGTKYLELCNKIVVLFSICISNVRNKWQVSYHRTLQVNGNSENSHFNMSKHLAFFDKRVSITLLNLKKNLSLKIIPQEKIGCLRTLSLLTFSSIDGSFLPNILLKIVWNINIMMLRLFTHAMYFYHCCHCKFLSNEIFDI